MRVASKNQTRGPEDGLGGKVLALQASGSESNLLGTPVKNKNITRHGGAYLSSQYWGFGGRDQVRRIPGTY